MTGPMNQEPRLKFLVDESFDMSVVAGVRQENSGIDIVSVPELGREGTPDPEVLELAAQEGRILLTRDKKTMTRDAYARIIAGQPTPGVFVAFYDTPRQTLIEEILLLADGSLAGE